jgi:hypothetical protein
LAEVIKVTAGGIRRYTHKKTVFLFDKCESREYGEREYDEVRFQGNKIKQIIERSHKNTEEMKVE